tara:strand:+ start:2827 stop:3165 length:339 start_codon:yes stop_codon:yes gene_type:complete
MVWLHLWVGEMGGLLQCRVLLKLVLLVILFVVHFLCLSKENETKEKTPSLRNFLPLAKNRSKTPRRYAPVFGAFQRIFCTSGFRAAHGIKYKSIVNLGVRGPGVEAKALGTS